MRLSDLPSGASVFDEHINPREEEYCCCYCGARVDMPAGIDGPSRCLNKNCGEVNCAVTTEEWEE